MATVHYTAKVKDSRLLELPEEAQALGLRPGEEIGVSVDHNRNDSIVTFLPNKKMLAALAEIAELNKGCSFSDGSTTQDLLSEARAGAMYGYDPTE